MLLTKKQGRVREMNAYRSICLFIQ